MTSHHPSARPRLAITDVFSVASLTATGAVGQMFILDFRGIDPSRGAGAVQIVTGGAGS